MAGNEKSLSLLDFNKNLKVCESIHFDMFFVHIQNRNRRITCNYTLIVYKIVSMVSKD